jgi:hypothetical protein
VHSVCWNLINLHCIEGRADVELPLALSIGTWTLRAVSGGLPTVTIKITDMLNSNRVINLNYNNWEALSSWKHFSPMTLLAGFTNAITALDSIRGRVCQYRLPLVNKVIQFFPFAWSALTFVFVLTDIS